MPETLEIFLRENLKGIYEKLEVLEKDMEKRTKFIQNRDPDYRDLKAQHVTLTKEALKIQGALEIASEE